MRRLKTILLFGLIFTLNVGMLSAEEPEQKFEGFNLQGYDDTGEKAWEVNGDSADIVGSEIILHNVDADTFGEEKVNVVAKTGVVDQTSGKMHLEEDVVITSEGGQRLMTDSLDWNRNEDLVTTDDDVVITGDKMMANGTGMHAQPNLKIAQINKDVTVVVDTETNEVGLSKTVTVTSDGPMVIDQMKSIATFTDNVVAFQDNQTLKGDYMEIHFDEGMSGIQKMICTGNVEIEKDGNKSYAQKAEYNATAQKLTLSGRPKLILITQDGGFFAATGD